MHVFGKAGVILSSGGKERCSDLKRLFGGIMMPRRVYYGSYQAQRKHNNRKKVIIIVSVIAVIAVIIWLSLFFGAIRQRDLGDMMKVSVNKITELKLQLEEKDDEIAALKQQIAAYEIELAARPTIAPTPVPPPNDTVMAGQATSVPTKVPSAVKKPKATANPAEVQPAVSAEGQISQPAQEIITEPAQQPAAEPVQEQIQQPIPQPVE